MDQIKAKYAKYKVTDPKRADMNAEIMKLQKDNGVNVLGGCIPSLMQLPLLFAFYSVLPKVTELHLQHWYWMPDLTGPDPLHILAVLIVVSSFLVTFYMPSPGADPQQQKMMAFMMPAFSGYIAWNYASSFSLYWITGNLVMIVQQLIMNQTSLGREMKEIAAKRARRKAGTGVIQGKR
jgi:YidC/Oxa1 family membrane protein insertase